MGGLKSLFGGRTPKVEKVAPTVQAVEGTDTSADTLNSTTTKKKRAGFSSTQAATALTSSNDNTNRTTLG